MAYPNRGAHYNVGAPTRNVQLADGTVVRGAKRGGITDHLAGMHLIPNVGREAMVPAECVRRQPRAKKKAAAPEPPKPQWKPKAAVKDPRRSGQGDRPRAKSRSRERRSRDRSRPRDRNASGGRSRSSSDPADDRARSPDLESPRRDDDAVVGREDGPVLESKALQAKSRQEEGRRPSAALTAQAKSRLQELEALKLEEERRLQEEQRKLRELEDARRKQKELEEKRRKKLGGAFALTEDSDAEDAEKEKTTRELARADKKAQERLASMAEARLMAGARDASLASASFSGGSFSPTRGAGGQSSSSRRETEPRARGPPIALPASLDDVNVTAADIDGAHHEHKFSKVWKDWDASKKDDPGEVARQFMKIAAIKRRGYEPTARGGSGGGGRGRSRSRSNQRR